ncbi:hypothetical protein E2542_SST31113 [Spatholobus suberectus]|nr:hypothetical protein E2542_SST31113 [Spatholobus suberectus]
MVRRRFARCGGLAAGFNVSTRVGSWIRQFAMGDFVAGCDSLQRWAYGEGFIVGLSRGGLGSATDSNSGSGGFGVRMFAFLGHVIKRNRNK